MAKKTCWFGWVKRLFIEAKTKAEKKSKRWRWGFGRLKFNQHPALVAPKRTLSEATEEQRKHALNVAIATAAAAEAAVAAAQAAAEVVRLAGASKHYHHFKEADRNLAAIKIQSSFRAYLARKALRALKGLVRLQAIVRGRAVRRQAIVTLKCLPSNAKMQSEVQERSIPTADGTCTYIERKHRLNPKEELKEKVLECNNQRSWDCSTLLKEDMEAILLRKQDATVKRERMLKYSYSQRERRNTQMMVESVHTKESGRRICQPEQWEETEAYDREGPKTLKLKNMQKQDSLDGLISPFSFPRRSFCHVEQDAEEVDSLILNSPGLPTYMAVTQSAKAKARSMSTPKQQVGFMDPCFDNHMPYKNRLSFWSSYNGESISTNAKSGNSHQISVSMNCHH